MAVRSLRQRRLCVRYGERRRAEDSRRQGAARAHRLAATGAVFARTYRQHALTRVTAVIAGATLLRRMVLIGTSSPRIMTLAYDVVIRRTKQCRPSPLLGRETHAEIRTRNACGGSGVRGGRRRARLRRQWAPRERCALQPQHRREGRLLAVDAYRLQPACDPGPAEFQRRLAERTGGGLAE